MSHSVIHAVAREMLLTPNDITGPVRTPYMVKARKMCAVILRDRYHYSFPQIARILHRDNHTTVRHHYLTGKALIESNEMLAALVERHMVRPKLPPVVVSAFVPAIAVRLNPQIRNPLTALSRRARIVERIWIARHAA